MPDSVRIAEVEGRSMGKRENEIYFANNIMNA
jgi:hypothetical protein